MGSSLAKVNHCVQSDASELIPQIDKQCIQKIFSPGFDEVMKKKLVSRLHKIVKSVERTSKAVLMYMRIFLNTQEFLMKFQT